MDLRKLRRTSPLVLAGIFAFLLLLAPLHAADTPITSFESDILLNQDGSAVVVERIELPFSSVPFERRIQTQFPGIVANRRLLVDLAEVARGDSGQPVDYYTIETPQSLTIRIARPNTRSLRIMYGIRNAVRFTSDHDEFFWLGNNVNSPTDSANVTLTLPPAAKGQVRAQAFLRSYDGRTPRMALWSSTGLLPLQVEGNVIRAGAPGPLAPGVTMVFDVFLPPGILHRPNVLTRTEWFLRANPIVFLPLATLLLMLCLRRLKPAAGAHRTIVTAYEPPPGLSPAEVGLLVDDRLDPRDISATLVDLAVRGYIRLQESKPEEGFFTDSPDYFVHLAKPREEWVTLSAHERTMLFHTFYGGQWTKLSSLRLRFPAIVQYFKADLLGALKRKGMYRVDPGVAQVWRIAALAAVAALLAFAQVLGIVSLADSWALSAISMAVSIVFVLWLGRGLTAKTARGRKAWAAVRGFDEFLRTVEGDRMRQLEPGIFEKYMPYAMALGIEHKWARAFQGIAIERPEWMEIASGELLDSVRFGQRLDLMFQQAILTAPRGRLSQPVWTYFRGRSRAASA